MIGKRTSGLPWANAVTSPIERPWGLIESFGVRISPDWIPVDPEIAKEV